MGADRTHTAADDEQPAGRLPTPPGTSPPGTPPPGSRPPGTSPPGSRPPGGSPPGGSPPGGAPPGGAPPGVSLFWRVFLLNAAVLAAATTALLLGPVTVSTPALLTEAVVLVAGLAALLVANALVLRVGLAPLARLARTMSTIDLLRPGPRLPASGRGEIAELIAAFNSMLDRLEAERAASTGRALSAQEGERRRIAQELHDEIGQTLTAVLLELKDVADRAPAPLRESLHEVQETTRNSLDEIRRIARRLRPGVLEELGLTKALRALTAEFTGPGLTVRHHIGADLPPLSDETELVLYRVAQESLTNTARHARARRAEIRLESMPGAVGLRVRDDGRGTGGAPEGAGIRGMRERALLVNAALDLGPAPGGGTEVRLTIPVPERNTPA
ncbi:HAMP domain-containing sensor histidine kinase [Streptomyces fradiae]|uniref:sensor histidine kinase n=1 Tax=Streptomyces fradiae TaxID=1906 RepID=UPI002187A8FB|nr:HAMP domain-containing sensor histidine kinase [Streptomyces fradiae]